MPATATRVVTDDIDPQVIAEIERFGLKWHVEAQYEVARLSPDRRVQVRDANHFAKSAEVNEYANHMKGGAKFPPGVVTSGDLPWIIDANTRVGAVIKLQQAFFPMIVLDIDYNAASTKQQDELYALGAALNKKGAKRLTVAETKRAATVLIRLDWTSDRIARTLGASTSLVFTLRRKMAAEEKLSKVGLTVRKESSNGNGQATGLDLRQPALQALGRPDCVVLNDQPYRELAELTAAADLSVNEITDVAKRAKEAGSDTGASAVIQNLRTEMGERIRIREQTGRPGRPAASGRMRQHLGSVVKAEGSEPDLVETSSDPAVLANYLQVLRTGIKVLSRVVELQEARMQQEAGV